MSDYNSMSEEEKKELIKKSSLNIKFINNPSEELQLLAVNNNGLSIRHIKNPSEKVKWAAIKQIPHACKYLKNISDEMQRYVVGLIPDFISKFENPSEEAQIMACFKTPHIVCDIANPCEDAIIAAVTKGHPYILKNLIRIHSSFSQLNSNRMEGNPSLDINKRLITEKVLISALKANWTEFTYNLCENYVPQKSRWFYRELNRLKLTKGPLAKS